MYEASLQLVGDPNFTVRKELLPDSFGPPIEARHLLIDSILSELLTGEHQFVELAAGLSTRAVTLSSSCPSVMEVDLPSIALLKRQACKAVSPLVRVAVIGGDLGLAATYKNIRAELLPNFPVAIVTEGLLWYLSEAQQSTLFSNVWRILNELGGFFVIGDAPAKNVGDDSGHISPNSKDFDPTEVSSRREFTRYVVSHGFDIEYFELTTIQNQLSSTWDISPDDLGRRLAEYGDVAVLRVSR